jgi:hypothetical protein
MEFWDSYELIGAVKKNEKTEIRIAKASKGGNSGIDIRNYFEKDGEFIGTGKGLFIGENNVAEFLQTINTVFQEAAK